MDQKKVVEDLQALAKQDSTRSKAARFRDVYAAVEEVLSAGVRQQAVVDVLANAGLEMTLGEFKTNLQRTRARAAKEGNLPRKKAPVAVAPPRAVAVQAATRPERSVAEEPEEQSELPKGGRADLEEVMGRPVDLDQLAKISKRKPK
ncbi:hypothetical protein [Metapseudomonas otitidis]|uniref:hypothetical protein n=1 Tax=Metapseudomonas otitidis TaxID=319939 RepID=UPI000D1AF27F|nr:hypothetical protein [Pseudomonas otitidis]